MKKTFSFILAITLMLLNTSTIFASNDGAMSNFKISKIYTENQFSDVLSTDWFAENVKTAYELGLVSGTSETTFSPNANITIAETITLACRLNNIYKGNHYEFKSGTPWYESYVNYALEKQIITQYQFGSCYDVEATRADFAAILEKALPDECLKIINQVDDNTIPDVKKDSRNSDAIYKLYRAGILVGNDNSGTFAPETNIDRASVATIISRMAIPDIRAAITLKKIPVEKITVKEKETLGVGASKELVATVYPENATEPEFEWSSSDTSIVSVSGNKITAISTGTATVTCKSDNGTKASCDIEVVPFIIEGSSVGVYVHGNYVFPGGTIYIPLGEETQLEAKVLPEKANANNDVTWTFTGSDKFLSLSADGKILGKTLHDYLRIYAILPDGLKTQFDVVVGDFSWNTYFDTKTPTYTSVTGVEVKNKFFIGGDFETFNYEYTSDSDVSKYHRALLDKGFTVYDYEDSSDDERKFIETYYDTKSTVTRQCNYDFTVIKITYKIICVVRVTDNEVIITHILVQVH